ncbi:aminotransferase, class I/II [Filifactor alocis ATCC 35896]|uniref:Aminotransferase n=1 Tax=Filifactor alocis (strain ATCC 35896 / CCUG 47790 / D40 B5) TaxID=546269 RepID=D6GSD5_FILAD|nr:pyridoxal phosphate-dependent aminotransferase [Filifactor alocis]EFE28576.1 aminotransferase, class I/II [Filifactor alocis ATCC 35896]
MKFSNRITSMQASPIRRLVPYAEKARKAGKKVYPLNIGQPDIKTPPAFFEALGNFNKKVLAYDGSQGNPELIKAISNYYKTYNMDFQDDEILITNGGSEALLFAIIATCDAGDEVLVPEPFYTNYNGFASAVNVTVDGITTKAEEGFHLPKKEDLVKKIKPNTKSIILSNPGNPTGVVYTKDELKMLVDICIEHNLFILADEVYREFVYDGLEYISLGNFKEAEDRVIIIDSVSKRYSACGARIGSIASKNKDLIQEILKLCQGRLCVPTIEQIGAIELYKTPTDYFKEVNEEYTKRRDIVYGALQKMDGVICKEPKGAFYVSVKLPVDNAEKFIIWCLEEFDYNGETLMMAPLEGFYSTPGIGEDEARIAYILNTEELQKAMTVLDKALQAYPGRK